MKKAVIITENQYPCGDAGAIRQHTMAKLIEQTGYSVVVFGYGKSTENKMCSYDGIEYISFRPKSSNKLIRILYRLAAPRRMMHLLKKVYSDAELVFVADASDKTFEKLNRYTKKCNLILIHDSVEWFSREEFKHPKIAPTYIMRNRINSKLVGKGWRVIAISRFLEDHFAKTADKTCRIPVVMDVSSIECDVQSRAEGDKIKFAYVGSPGKKDYLKSIIDGFAAIDKALLSKVELHIVGANRQQLISVCGVDKATIERLGETLVVHGRVPHDDAIAFVRNADYTLLFRDAELRYAKAGFPTKIVESLSSGTPPICNISSDLGLYLKDGENAYIAKDHSPESVKEVLERAMAATASDRNKMRSAARKTAEENFDYSKYVDVFAELIKE